MPQDSLKSVVYRSFVTCDDPKGVVECGTIRKSKTSSKKMEHKKMEESLRMRKKNLNISCADKEEKNKEKVSMGITENFHSSPSSFQLLQVSRGAQKLNQMIDSWSNGLGFEGQSKDIAKDLMRGALDLQESLVMLGKLQEASQYMAKLKKKHKEKSERGRVDEVGMERSNSDRFGDLNLYRSNSDRYGDHQTYHMAFQKPRLSTDDSIEELRRMIRDSLTRHNLLPNSSSKEKAYYDKRRLDSASDLPSTSSSQSSMVYSSNSGYTDSSASVAAPEKKKAKSPNLIARLMGLEESPQSPSQAASDQKQLAGEQMSNHHHRKPIFDIEMPKARKPNFVSQKVDPEKRTLKEILETMHFKGLLKNNSVKEEQRILSHHPNNFPSERRLMEDNMPLIVIMKPMHFPDLESEQPLESKFTRKERALETKEMLRKVKIKEELPTATIDRGKGSFNAEHKQRKMETEEAPPVKRLSQEEGTKDSKMVAGKSEEREVKTKEKASSKMKRSTIVNIEPQKKEGTDKKAGKVQTVTTTGGKLVEDSVKRKILSKSQGANVTLAPSTNKNKSNIRNHQIPQQQTTSPNTISKPTTQIKNRSSTSQKKNQEKKREPVKKPKAVSLDVETTGCHNDGMKVVLSSESENVLNGQNCALANQLPTEEKDVPETENREHCNDERTSLREATVIDIQLGTIPAEEESEHKVHNDAESKSSKTTTILKDFLMNCPSFLRNVEELFDLSLDHCSTLQTSSFDELGEADTKLVLDCANEIIARVSLRQSQSVCPVLQTQTGNLRVFVSADQLVEEVCDGVDKLRSSKMLKKGENLPIDSIYAMLDRDLKGMGIASAIWDSGWKNGYSVDEEEQVVAGIEKLVLGGMIEEVLQDFFALVC